MARGYEVAFDQLPGSSGDFRSLMKPGVEFSVWACIQSIAFMTDEKKARQFAEKGLMLGVETTPKLYAWLLYNHHLVSGDHEEVLREHEHYEERPLTQFMQEAYEEAMRCQLFSRAI